MYLRFFIIIALFLSVGLISFGADVPLACDVDVMQKKLLETGFRLLNSNDIQKHVFFYYDISDKIQVQQYFYTKKIVFYQGAIKFIENDDEFAALIARELAYSMDMRFGIFRRTSMSYNPRKYELKADRRAVDYLVNAGYNPVGLITVYNKLLAEPSAFGESFFVKHKGSERIMSIYDYIYQKYPYFIAHNEYLRTPVYQNFLKTSKKERKKSRLLQQTRLELLRKYNSDVEKSKNEYSISDFSMYNMYNQDYDYGDYESYGLEELENFVNLLEEENP